jgi:hypothetical protein
MTGRFGNSVLAENVILKTLMMAPKLPTYVDAARKVDKVLKCEYDFCIIGIKGDL